MAIHCKEFKYPSLSNWFISVKPNNWSLCNNFVHILKDVINIVTWKSECIKFSHIIITSIYWFCTLTQLYFFNWRNIITTYISIKFVTFTDSMHIFFRGDLLPSFLYIISFFTGWNISICYLISLFVINFYIISVYIIYFYLILFN